jgi:hypothetical protein
MKKARGVRRRARTATGQRGAPAPTTLTAVGSPLRLVPARDAVAATPESAELNPPGPADFIRGAERLLLDQYAPPGVIVNDRMEIIHFCGRTGPYLEPAPGQPHHDLFRMVRPGLVADLHMAFAQVRRAKASVRRAGVAVEQNGSSSRDPGGPDAVAQTEGSRGVVGGRVRGRDEGLRGQPPPGPGVRHRDAR